MRSSVTTITMIQTSTKAPLDSGFLPAVLFNRSYQESVRASGKGVPLVLGLERENGLVSRFETIVLPSSDATTRSAMSSAS